ncbi:MAG: type I methionyl aminopeptidase [Planctomycetes bacterium]|nr:type I methionyl aminopeptidase [Planctomycetota bacterium]
MSAKGNRGIVLKSRREIELMRTAGALVNRVLTRVEELVAPGVTTSQMNDVAEEMIAQAGAVPLFKGVTTPQARTPFPAALCTSVNEEVVHGVPSDRALKEGDMVSVDCGVRLNGYCGDSARTIAVGQVSAAIRSLMDATQEALELAIGEVRHGRMWSEVAGEIQRFVEGRGFSVVREFVGHGIGQEMHEEPKVPNFVDRKHRQQDFELVEGMTLAVEPMVNLGRAEVVYAGRDRWAVCTKDHSCAAHYEHVVAVTANGADVLTDGRMP